MTDRGHSEWTLLLILKVNLVAYYIKYITFSGNWIFFVHKRSQDFRLFQIKMNFHIVKVLFCFVYMMVNLLCSFFDSPGPSWRRGKPSWSHWPPRSRTIWGPLPPSWRSMWSPWPRTYSPWWRTSRSRWRTSSRGWWIRPVVSPTKRAVPPKKNANVPPQHLLLHHGLSSWSGLHWRLARQRHSLKCVSVLVNTDIYFLCTEAQLKTLEHIMVLSCIRLFICLCEWRVLYQFRNILIWPRQWI